ncbi:MAG: type II toxin-antitoxin system prevent-host-death family antitoxin [Dehalococcoidia bacterium]|nr:type II toxin-antitoxin system prevent-host-death family antitoxin [Dehalococcoidia bacterium]
MDSKWSFEDAREHLDEVVRRAHESGPQVLTEHGEESAVVLSCEEYARLRGGVSVRTRARGLAVRFRC